MPQLNNASISGAAAADLTVIAAVTGKTYKVFQLHLVAAGAATIQFKDGASNLLSGIETLTTGVPLILPNTGVPWFVTTSGNAFIINQSAVQVSGSCQYEIAG